MRERAVLTKERYEELRRETIASLRETLSALEGEFDIDLGRFEGDLAALHSAVDYGGLPPLWSYVVSLMPGPDVPEVEVEDEHGLALVVNDFIDDVDVLMVLNREIND